MTIFATINTRSHPFAGLTREQIVAFLKREIATNTEVILMNQAATARDGNFRNVTAYMFQNGKWEAILEALPLQLPAVFTVQYEPESSYGFAGSKYEAATLGMASVDEVDALKAELARDAAAPQATATRSNGEGAGKGGAMAAGGVLLLVLAVVAVVLFLRRGS